MDDDAVVTLKRMLNNYHNEEIGAIICVLERSALNTTYKMLGVTTFTWKQFVFFIIIIKLDYFHKWPIINEIYDTLATPTGDFDGVAKSCIFLYHYI